jgi:hypothetical protein
MSTEFIITIHRSVALMSRFDITQKSVVLEVGE